MRNVESEIQSTILFVSEKMKYIRESKRDSQSLDIKEISDLQRYSETLSSLSICLSNLRKVDMNG